MLTPPVKYGANWDSLVPIVAVKAAAGEYDYTIQLPDGHRLGINYIDIDVPRETKDEPRAKLLKV